MAVHISSYRRAGALTLVILLFIAVVNASPLQGSRAATELDSTDIVDQSSLTITSPWATEGPSTSLTKTNTISISRTPSLSPSSSEMVSVLRRDARISGSTSGPTAIFCKAFVEQCYHIALGGQSGEVTVSHSCERNGDKYSTSFTYSCYRGTKRLTPAVLKAMGKEFNTPITTTIDESGLVTKVIEEVSTVYDVITTRTTTSTDATTTRITTTQILVDVDVYTIPSTVSSTTIIPFTSFATATSTLTAVTTTTSTSIIRTVTQAFIGTAPIAVRAVVNDLHGEVQQRAPSTFCLAFRIACQNECRRVTSRVDVEICDPSNSPVYNMACICTNGKRETQHALEAVAEDRRIVSITTGRTSTTYLTSTRTTTIPTETLSLQRVTRTSLMGTTSTSYTSTTTTFGQTTEYTGLPSTVTTLTITVPTTTTRTMTTTTSVTTTTRIVLAATGYVHAFDTTSGADVGTVATSIDSEFAQLFVEGTSSTKRQFMAIRSNPGALFQLAAYGDPENVLLQTANESDPVFRGGTPYYALLNFGPAARCGSNAHVQGPVDSSTTCETFIWSPGLLAPSVGATPDIARFIPTWLNPTGTTPDYWGGLYTTSGEEKILTLVADRAAFLRSNPNWPDPWFLLRFPFDS